MQNLNLTQPLVTNWLERYRQDYIAHAVYAAQTLRKVMASKTVCSAEQIFREQGEVEYEAGLYGNRKVHSLPKLSKEDVDRLLQLESEMKEEEERNKREYRESFNTEEEFKAERDAIEGGWRPCVEGTNLEYHVEIRERIKYARKKSSETDEPENGNYRFQADTPLWYTGLEKASAFREYVLELKEKYGMFSREEVLIAYDRDKPLEERFDYGLNQAFLDLCKQHSLPSYYAPNAPLEERRLYNEIYTACDKARQSVFGTRQLGPTIRAAHNGILWNYAHETGVVVCVGGSQTLIGRMTREAHLLAPWQNNGNFFNIPLTEDNVLILGPKSILEPYNIPDSGMKIAYLEDLSSEQRAFFDVPDDIMTSVKLPSTQPQILKEKSLGHDSVSVPKDTSQGPGSGPSRDLGKENTEDAFEPSSPSSSEESSRKDEKSDKQHAFLASGKLPLTQSQILKEKSQGPGSGPSRDLGKENTDDAFELSSPSSSEESSCKDGKSSQDFDFTQQDKEKEKDPPVGNTDPGNPPIQNKTASLKHWHWISLLVGVIALASFVTLACLLPLRFPDMSPHMFWAIEGGGFVLGTSACLWGTYGLSKVA